jgi:hypothetical protein
MDWRKTETVLGVVPDSGEEETVGDKEMDEKLGEKREIGLGLWIAPIEEGRAASKSPH